MRKQTLEVFFDLKCNTPVKYFWLKWIVLLLSFRKQPKILTLQEKIFLKMKVLLWLMTIFQVRGTETTNNRSTQHHIDNGETDHKSSYSQKPPITYSKAPFQNLPSPTATSSRLMKFFWMEVWWMLQELVSVMRGLMWPDTWRYQLPHSLPHFHSKQRLWSCLQYKLEYSIITQTNTFELWLPIT